jgi:hypothetical protein
MAKKPSATDLIGSWAFLIGAILAVIFAFIGQNFWVTVILVIIGIIVGLLNITVHEVQPFLLAGTVLVILSALGAPVFKEIEVRFVEQFLKNVLYLFVPATLIVALRSLWALSRSA